MVRFVAYMLDRNIRIEQDLIDQLFNSSEKRLARTLLLLARYGKQDEPQKVLPTISQETLAEMIGTTRSRVNFFMNKFKKLGFIEYNGGLHINTSLLSVALHEKSPTFARRNVAVVRSSLYGSTNNFRATGKVNKTRMCLDVNRYPPSPLLCCCLRRK